MKKGLVIALVVAVIGIVGYMAMNPPAPREAAPSAGTETAEMLAEVPAPAETEPEAPAEMAAVEAQDAPAPAVQAAPAAVPPINTAELNVPLIMSERIMGDINAPVTVIEYASLTCPHCAHFATTVLPQVKAKLVETGRMRLIFRDFPLDAMAMKAAKLAKCAPQDKYFDFIEVIFRNRDRWLTSDNPEGSLMQLGALTGMTDEYMKMCMGSAELENAILQVVSDAQQKFVIKSTPTFVFEYGAESFAGAQDVSKFEEVVDRLSAGKKK